MAFFGKDGIHDGFFNATFSLKLCSIEQEEMTEFVNAVRITSTSASFSRPTVRHQSQECRLSDCTLSMDE
jgi:hypothetical protein